MIIKLLGQPIISIVEAEIAGTVDGVIIKGNKVSSFYHRNMENHFAIPIEKAIIGSEAVMIQDVSAITLASQNVKSLKSMLDVYNISGKHLGCLREIEVDDQLILRYICTEDYRIEMSKTVNYESVIVVDVEEAELEMVEAAIQDTVEEVPVEAVEASEGESTSESEAALSMEIGPEIKWNAENQKQKEKGLDSAELSVVRSIHQNDEKDVISGVDEKYSYLCGKQILEGIDIENIFYDKGTIISPEMIRHAIGNNAIVKVIVNAED